MISGFCHNVNEVFALLRCKTFQKSEDLNGIFVFHCADSIGARAHVRVCVCVFVYIYVTHQFNHHEPTGEG